MQSKLTTVAYPVYNTIQNDGILFHTHIALLVTKSRLFMPVLVVLTRTHLCEYPLSLEKNFLTTLMLSWSLGVHRQRFEIVRFSAYK